MRNRTISAHVVVGVCVLLFIVFTIWLVCIEGERTREAIRESTQEATGEVREGMLDAAEWTVDKAAELPGRVVQDAKDQLSEGAVEATEQVVGTFADLAGTVLGGADEKKPDDSPAASGDKTPTSARGRRAEHAVNDRNTTTFEPTAASPTVKAEEPDTNVLSTAPTRPDDIPRPNPAVAQGSANIPGRTPESASSTSNASHQRSGAPRQRETRPEDPADMVGRLFDLGHEVVRSIDEIGQDALALSEVEEREVSARVQKLVAKQNKILRAPRVVRRLQNLARPLLLHREHEGIKYTISVLDEEKVNAFAHVGGYLYVTKGLLRVVTDDGELQFVLAHEIGHVDMKHCTRLITYAARASEFGGEVGSNLAQLAYTAIALGYSEDQEFEADRYGLLALQRVGRDGNDAVTCLRRLAKHFDSEPQGSQPDRLPDTVRRTVEETAAHFRSHPPTQERIERLEELLKQPTPR